jgi:hypothetical protein
MALRGRALKWPSLLNGKLAIALVCIALIGWLAAAFALDNKQILLPGHTSVGHDLFEASCSSSHEGDTHQGDR